MQHRFLGFTQFLLDRMKVYIVLLNLYRRKKRARFRFGVKYKVVAACVGSFLFWTLRLIQIFYHNISSVKLFYINK